MAAIRIYPWGELWVGFNTCDLTCANSSYCNMQHVAQLCSLPILQQIYTVILLILYQALGIYCSSVIKFPYLSHLLCLDSGMLGEPRSE